ncbi:hypothetical protein LCGC14_2778300, partial [marine sediment metagenome]
VGVDRDGVTKAFTSDKVKEVIKRREIKLLNYGDLKVSGAKKPSAGKPRRFFSDSSIEVESITRKKDCQDEWIRLTDRWRKSMLGLPHDNVAGTEASWELAKEIVKDEFPPEYSKPENYQQKVTMVKGKGTSGKGEKGEKGEGDGEGGAGEEGKGKSKGGIGTGNVIVSDHAEQGKLSDANYDPGQGDKFVNSGTGTHTFDPGVIHMPRVEKRDGPDNTSSQARKYANRLRTLIQAETYPQWVRGLDKGRRLANNRLYRVGLPDHDPDQRKIWQRKIEKDNPTLDTAVSIIVDMSQSMGETMSCGTSMIKVACDIAGSLDHALRDILHIQVEVLGFTANNRRGNFRDHQVWAEGKTRPSGGDPASAVQGQQGHYPDRHGVAGGDETPASTRCPTQDRACHHGRCSLLGDVFTDPG